MSREHTLLAFLALLSASVALTVEDINEGPCIPVQTDKHIDIKWMYKEVKTWYFRLLSKADLYESVAVLLEKPIDQISKDEAERSCMEMSSDSEGMFLQAFGNVKKYFTMSMKDGKTYGQLLKDGKPHGEPAEMALTLTDNKSFAVYVSCFEGKRTFSVAQPSQKPLSKSTLKFIKEYVHSMGFGSNYFAEVNYDNCMIKTKDEL